MFYNINAKIMPNLAGVYLFLLDNCEFWHYFCYAKNSTRHQTNERTIDSFGRPY